MSIIMTDVRYYLITTESMTTWNYINGSMIKMIPIALVVLVLLCGALYFRKKSKKFAEEV